MVVSRSSLLVLSVLLAVTFARPGPPNYPSEEENIIPDYAYENEDSKSDPSYVGGWKSFPLSNPDKLYDEEVPAITVETPSAEIPSAETPSAETPSAETPSAETPSAETPIAENRNAETLNAVPNVEVIEVARAADVAGSVGAVAAVHAVEVVKAAQAALETTEAAETTTTTEYPADVSSGRALGDEDERPLSDAPTPDQSLYGFSKFLHDLLQVPVQVMRSVSSYLTGALSRRDSTSPANSSTSSSTTPEQHALTSAMLSQSF